MRRHVEMILAAVCVVVFGACASSNMGGAQGNMKTYTADINTVVKAATAVFEENNLDIEDKAWTSDSSYVITGYIRSALVRIQGEAVSVNAVKLFVDQINDQQTRVRIETSAREVHAMASSADRRSDEEAQWFFARLDARLGVTM